MLLRPDFDDADVCVLCSSCPARDSHIYIYIYIYIDVIV